MASGNAHLPLLLFTAFPAAGHTTPLLQIAEEMVKRGYEVVFVSAKQYEAKIRHLGAEFIETLGLVGGEGLAGEGPPEPLDDLRRRVLGILDGDPGSGPAKSPGFEHLLGQVPGRTQIMHDALERIRDGDPLRQIIIVQEAFSMCVSPFHFGRRLPKGFTKFPRTITINIIPLFLQSIDTAPFFTGLPPDSTDAGRRRNQILHRHMIQDRWKSIADVQNRCLAKAGATALPSTDIVPLDVLLMSSDACLQMCSPQLEYPRSDLPVHIKFAGCLPRKPVPANYPYPEWWPDITDNTAGKKIVFVAQGTISVAWNDLVIPTLQGLSDREDLLVVATLGVRGASLPDTLTVPSNARVHDFLLYDAILPHVDVFVTNSGYGSMTHAVVNGVPQVLAGESEDKREVSARVEWAGFGYNTKTQFPSPAEILKAVDTVLADPRYKQRAVELQLVSEEMDAMSRVERQIQEFSH